MSDENKGYNGWSNYETWNVALWMGNESGSAEMYAEYAEEAYAEAEADKTFTREENATLALADRIKAEHEEYVDSLNVQGFAGDLLGAAMSEVNWHEIAEHYISDVDKTEEAGEDETETD